MDIDNFEKNVDIVMRIIHRYMMYPFIALLAAGSRVFYEGFVVKKKMPTKMEVVAIVVMSMFTSTVTYLIAMDLGITKLRITWLVLIMGFVSHNAVLWLLENWYRYLPQPKENKKDDTTE